VSSSEKANWHINIPCATTAIFLYDVYFSRHFLALSKTLESSSYLIGEFFGHIPLLAMQSLKALSTES